MKVIVASFPKCGTKTLRDCLSLLGYTVYDYDENFTFLEKEWIDIMTNGASVDKFRKMYEDVDAVTDIPACVYWEKLHETFPNAKIILSTRKTDEEWLKSWDQQIHALETNIRWFIRCHFTPTGRRFFRFQRLKGRVTLDCPPQKFYQSMNQPDPEIKKAKYNKHVQTVMERAPKDKLLLFDLKDGWEPLCEFLEKDIPDHPFPHTNKGSTVMQKGGSGLLFSRINHELNLLTFAVVALFAFCVLIYMK